ncbi:hypothetical protein A2U01_0100913, partial [Trifolium medium]|nr:hypothetical protein [Trifolium medium]
SITRTQNSVCAAGCVEDDAADDMLPQTLIFVQPCSIYLKLRMLLNAGGSSSFHGKGLFG